MNNLSANQTHFKVHIFIQSQLTALTELTFYYMNLVTVSRLERNPTVKAEIQLRDFEARLKEEVICHTLKHREKTKEYHRAVLALRWVQGVIRIKMMDDAKGV